MWERIRWIVWKEFRQVLREPRLRAMLFVPPIVQLLVFGFAVNLDVERARIGWMDLDGTQQSRQLLSAFTGSPRFELVAAPMTGPAFQELLDRGQVDAVIRVMPGFAADVRRGRTAEVQILVDGTNSNTASIVASYASQAIGRYAREALGGQQRMRLAAQTLNTGSPVRPNMPDLRVETRVWFNPDLRSKDYFVPGVVVNIVTLITLSLTAMAIVREKEIGTMEQLMVTPIRPLELMLGKTIPFALIGFFDTALVVVAALLIFDVPFRGNLLVLFFSTALFLLTTLGAGLFISTVARTQQQAMMSTFLFFMPFFLLSGFTFPVRNMPTAVQYLTLVNPVRYFMDIVRGIFLRGSGVEILWPSMLGLGVLGVAILSMSVLRFRRTLD
ncbi:MAG: ABC transporter permease [Bryobacteraceae bacterium]|nr:ABC transporter permease [Bryobacteraceae bacterium]